MNLMGLDHLFVASAGNENKLIHDDYRKITCGLKEPNLLCVVASTVNDGKWLASNYGPEYVHVFAPGSRILSTVPDNGYSYKSGTSMACPHGFRISRLDNDSRFDGSLKIM